LRARRYPRKRRALATKNVEGQSRRPVPARATNPMTMRRKSEI
jgi:hypothetical protein